MQHIYNNFPSHSEKRFSICDTIIDKITCINDTVRFSFSNGFYLLENGQVTISKAGIVELQHCDSQEFSCQIFKREVSPHGAVLFGQPISLDDLGTLLEREAKKIEIHLELYDFNYMYWRGTLLPYKEEGLSDWVVIETCGCFPMIFLWE